MRTPWHLRAQSASIQARTQNQTTGAQTYAAKSGMSAVPCTVQPDNSSEAIRYMRETGTRLSTIALPPIYGGTTISVDATDQIVVGSTTYKVYGPGMNAAGQGANLVVKAYEEA